MKERVFRFKEFSVSHGRSPMPIGVDGVLVGAWCETEGRRILDVGTGCGVIALIVASRFPEASVTAIDTDGGAVEEAGANFRHSSWSDRLASRQRSWQDMEGDGVWDLIVSNPPFFDSGADPLASARLGARHKGDLSPESLVSKAPGLLSERGRLAIIVPSDQEVALRELAESEGLSLRRVAEVADRETTKVKRVLLEFSKRPCACTRTRLVMFGPDGSPTGDYRRLTGKFYLKF